MIKIVRNINLIIVSKCRVKSDVYTLFLPPDGHNNNSWLLNDTHNKK